MSWSALLRVLSALILVPNMPLLAQQPAGSIRGVVYDKDFEAPLLAAQVSLVETGQSALTGDQGNFVLQEVPPGTYTLLFSKEGYVRQVRADVLVAPGQLTEVEAWLSGEFTEMEEFIVQDIINLGTTSEAALLELRFESPALMDSISADLMSRAGASDAASALRLVAGATVQDGRFAVIRGLPDRYVSSQLNGIRLPSADEDKRAVELDQFPAAVIDSVQVSKTFTPDQQGDASGGAVDLRLREIPRETIFQFTGQVGYNSQVTGRSDFLTYEGGGVGFLGLDDGGRDIQFDNIGGNWTGAAGVSRGDAPIDYKFTLATGGRHELDSGLNLGGFLGLFYERNSSFYDNGINDSYWVDNPGDPLTPELVQQQGADDFKTALFDVTQSSQSVQWGGLGTFGVESDDHAVALTLLYTHKAEDKATLAEDTRGKEYFFPGYDPNDSTGPGNTPQDQAIAPYIRTETLEYTERTAGTLQLGGRHVLRSLEPGGGSVLSFGAPEFDWSLSTSFAYLDQPDKRQFGGLWWAESFNPGAPPFVPPFTAPAVWLPFKPAANFNLGNFQRIWKTIEEENRQLALNLKLPFEQWGGERGYLKLGLFDDEVERDFNQDTFSNFGDAGASFQGDFSDSWSAVFPFENHPITESLFDVDYNGKQSISALYGMVDLPLGADVSVIGGARVESTRIEVVNFPGPTALWVPPGATAPITLLPGEADVDFSQDDLLPSIGLIWKPVKELTVRTSYSQTVARQTFKELTPILQQEYLGAPIFSGNPELRMSSLDNYDLRLDYVPYQGGLVSLSLFHKRVEDAIEYVQRLASFTFTTAVNYPKGRLSGIELELRQNLGNFWDSLSGFALGANATLIDSEVTLPDEDAAQFELPEIAVPMRTRDMTNAPEHLYNLFLTYDYLPTGTQVAVFYTITGDTLVAGAGQSLGNFVPDVYAKEFGTLNVTCFQRLGRNVRLQLQGKNLTNPTIETVYRSSVLDGDTTRTSFTRGYELSLGLQVSF